MAEGGRETATAGGAAAAHTDFSTAMSYGDYLQLDLLLAAQKPLSDQHDEMLFIVMHQVSELWMKLVLHEIDAARALIRSDDLAAALKATARVSRVQAQLIQSWDVLATMTPADYLRFRDVLGHASGFQSAQYRLIEFALGNKSAERIAPHRHDAGPTATLETALRTPSLYDEALRLLARRGLPVAAAVLDRDVTRPHAADPSVLAAWLDVYRDTERHFELYELAEELVDIEDCFQQWRFRHVTTVQRIIGFRRGTGGTSGVGYLKGVLDTVFFPELWTVRTAL